MIKIRVKCKNCGDVVTPVNRGGSDVTPCTCFIVNADLVEELTKELMKPINKYIYMYSDHFIADDDEVRHMIKCVLKNNPPLNHGFYIKFNGWGGNMDDMEWLEYPEGFRSDE